MSSSDPDKNTLTFIQLLGLYERSPMSSKISPTKYYQDEYDDDDDDIEEPQGKKKKK